MYMFNNKRLYLIIKCHSSMKLLVEERDILHINLSVFRVFSYSRRVLVLRIFHQIFRICHVATPSGRICALCFARLIVTVGKLHRVSRLQAGRNLHRAETTRHSVQPLWLHYIWNIRSERGRRERIVNSQKQISDYITRFIFLLQISYIRISNLALNVVPDSTESSKRILFYFRFTK